MTETQSRLGETQAQVLKVLQEQALLAQEKDLLLMRKHTAEELKNPQKRKQFFDKEINSLQLQINLNTKEMQDADKAHLNYSKQLETAVKSSESKQQDLQQTRQKIEQAARLIEQARADKTTIAGKVKKHLFLTNEAELTLKSFKQKLAQAQ